MLVENIVTGALIVVALGLTAIAFRAWRHSRSTKVLFLTLGFGLFLVKGLVLGVGLFTVSPWEQLLVPTIVIDLGIVGVFYLAALA